MELPLAYILQTIITLMATSLTYCAKKKKRRRMEDVTTSTDVTTVDTAATDNTPEMVPNALAEKAEKLNKEGTKTKDEVSTTVEGPSKCEKPPASSDLPTTTISQKKKNKKKDAGEISTQADGLSKTTQNTKRSLMVNSTAEVPNTTQNSRSQRKVKNKRERTPKPTKSALDLNTKNKKGKNKGGKTNRSTAETPKTNETINKSKEQGRTVTRETQDETRSKAQGTQETKTDRQVQQSAEKVGKGGQQQQHGPSHGHGAEARVEM